MASPFLLHVCGVVLLVAGVCQSLDAQASRPAAVYPLLPEASATTAPLPPGQPAAETSFEQQARALRATPDWHRMELSRGTQETFGPVLGVLLLPKEAEPRLLALIVERRQRWFDRRAQLDAARDAATRGGHPDQAPTPADYRSAQRAIEAEVDDAIRTLVGNEKFPQVAAMIAAGLEISSVPLNDGKRMAEAGCPLTAAQQLQLGLALHAADDPATHPDAADRAKLPLNQRGLTSLDEQLLTQLQSVLSPAQLVVLGRNRFVLNRHLRSLPVEWECDCDLPPDAPRLIGDWLAARGNFGSVSVQTQGSGRARLERASRGDTATVGRDYCGVYCAAFPTGRDGQPLLMTWYCVALFDDAGRLVAVADENQLTWLHRKPRAKSPFDA